MRSVVYESFGNPEEVLRPGERPRPEPGAGQILVGMVLSPIHNHDLMTAAGAYGHRPSLPAVGGTEAVGIVEALGEGVANLSPGQRVAGSAQETWAEYFLADAARVIPVPDTIEDATACQLLAMPLSAKMLLAELGLQRGDWLVQNAANGAVGKLVARFATEEGINVLGLVRRDAAVEELRILGIETAVSTEQAGWQDRVRDLTGGAPVLRGVDSLGGEGAMQVAEVMADGGTITSFGAMTERPLQIPAGLLLFRGMTINGFWAAKPNLPAEAIRRMIDALVQAAAAGRLELPVDEAFGLEEIAEAVRASRKPGRTGKVVLRP